MITRSKTSLDHPGGEFSNATFGEYCTGTDNDWLRAVMTEDWCVVSFSEDGARGNTWIESVWSRFCQENHSLLIESATIRELIAVIDDRMRYYNLERRHSSVDNLPPIIYAQRGGLIPENLSLK